MKKTVAYCRTAWESPDAPHYGVRRQAKLLRRYARDNCIRLSKIYQDAAQSGVSLNRPALQELLADCKSGEIGTVIIRDTDRLSRDVNLLAEITKLFNEHNVKLEFSTKHGEINYQFQQIIWGGFSELIQIHI